MATTPIAFVVIDEDGRLQVYPDVPRSDAGYQYIYRDASGIRWDDENLCLYSEIPRELSHGQWFTIILDAIEREYGDDLILTRHTGWVNVSDDLRTELLAKFADLTI